ncbi:MAG: YraN family protein [Gordonia paraffinivorans]
MEDSGRPPSRQLIGRRGEDAAAEHLLRQGCSVLERNWRCRWGELDIIAREGSTLVVVEVKTRTGDRFGTPAEAVTPAKYRRLRRLTGLWLEGQTDRWSAIRFDVVAVLLDLRTDGVALTHIRGIS